MSDLISRDAAIKLIEGLQRELCPAGMFGRHAVYGSDREKYDNWQYIIDELEVIPTVEAEPVVHARWVDHIGPAGYKTCFVECSNCRHIKSISNKTKWCPDCGAKMDGGNNNGKTD